MVAKALVICVREIKGPVGKFFDLGGVYEVPAPLAEHCPVSFRPVPSGAPCY